MRRIVFASLLLLAACGGGDDAQEAAAPELEGPAVCNLGAIAATLVGEAERCPPERCVIDSETDRLECQGAATESGGQACTRFVVAGDSCPRTCAPPTCALGADGLVACSGGCSPDGTTCFAVPAGSCPGTTN